MSTHAEAPTRPLIAIVGATGTGKSDLAVSIASKFNGEIINGDAMQLYDGLPIITNKMPVPERKGIPHHLLGCIGLNEPTWTVGKFVESAVNVIDDMRSRGKLPILVGGTHYYTQALLFKDGLVVTVEEQESQRSEVDLSILDEPTDVILAKLREVDPVMADRWHPNDRRKIQRSLEIYLKSGKPASEVYEDQLGRGSLSLRYETLIFWVHTSKDILFTRLDARVLKMMQNGLLDEVRMLEDIRQEKQNSGETVDITRGIWVSIGYKEFRKYQQPLDSAKDVSESDMVRLRSDAIEQAQAATRQYSNRQIRWIRIKLLNALSSANALDYTFILDGTDLTNWSQNVLKPASDIVDRFLVAEQLPDPKEISVPAKEYLAPKQDDVSKNRSLWVRQTCDLCGVTSVTATDWEKHITSHGHRKAVSAMLKRQRAVEKAG